MSRTGISSDEIIAAPFKVLRRVRDTKSFPDGEMLKRTVDKGGLLYETVGWKTLKVAESVLVVVQFGIEVDELSVDTFGRGDEGTIVQEPRQVAADVRGAHSVPVEDVPELTPYATDFRFSRFHCRGADVLTPAGSINITGTAVATERQ